MGIVAFCPNGHRIKVKDDLAGRKGICPTCSTRFRIPRRDAAPHGAPAPDVGVDPPVARVVSLDAQVAAALPMALPAADAADLAESVVEAVDAPVDFAPIDDAPNAPPQRGRTVLDERPECSWHIAVRGGTPSAPLDAAAMHAWLDSGAGSADHVVWRQDWPDWQPLAEVFPDALPPRPPAVP